jgi:hypothetical protein
MSTFVNMLAALLGRSNLKLPVVQMLGFVGFWASAFFNMPGLQSS